MSIPCLSPFLFADRSVLFRNIAIVLFDHADRSDLRLIYKVDEKSLIVKGYPVKEADVSDDES